MDDDSRISGLSRQSARSTMKKWATIAIAVAKATGIFLLPSPITNLFDLESHQLHSQHSEWGETTYLDGVRGLAATIVFIEHFGLPFYTGIVGSDGDEWSYLQLPVIRLFYHGSFAVCVFFVMSGLVLSRKSIRLERQAMDAGTDGTEAPDRANLAAQIHEALGSATLRRAPRLFLPSAVIVLLMAGLAFFLDAFAAAAEFPGLPRDLYRLDVPRRLPTLGAQLIDCLDFIMSQLIYPFPWMLDIPRQKGSTRPQTYGFHLWTIPVEFWASEMLFVVLLATSLRRRCVRPIIIILVSLCSVWCGRWEPPLFLAGAQLADIDFSRQIAEDGSSARLHYPSSRSFHAFIYSPGSRTCFRTAICLAGLWIGSMPDYNAARTFGFGALANLYTLPNSQVYWQGMGAVMFVWSTQHCRWLKRFLEMSVLQYLGQISFALYLVHVPIVTTFGWAIARFLLNISGTDVNSGAWDREVLVVVGGLLAFAATTWVADIFWRAVDAPAVRLSKRLESFSRL